ncbi:TRAM domain-containing protein [Natrononativus amylolyticus]|uniref:TRAM domain-containing protein n=1 Tax=Natrononativus amylolyticus TaxID=2963434 RepID=UPI0020CDBACC|nr:RNA-binding protein [Natrononativus amylolyticus]
MIGTGSLAIGLAMVVVFGWWLLGRLRGGRTADERESWERHRAARERDPPVDVGDVVTLGVTDFSSHHSGEVHAVGKVEGFVIFVEDLPEDLAVGDVIRAKVLSFNRGHTSASATYLERE